MKKNIDCEVFQDQLDTLKEARLSGEGMAQLQMHAEVCRECSEILLMHEHLALPSLEDLEVDVPDTYVASMWDSVWAEIASQESQRSLHPRDWGSSRWLTPALAAAAVLLLVATGFLLGELGELRGREELLVQRIVEHERRLASLEVTTSASVATGLVGRRAWERTLSRRETVSVAELANLLERLPPSTTIVDAARLEAMLESAPFWSLAGWSTALDEVRDADGVQVGELVRLLDVLDLDREMQIPVARLLALSGAGVRL